jgi:hypothetical protein
MVCFKCFSFCTEEKSAHPSVLSCASLLLINSVRSVKCLVAKTPGVWFPARGGFLFLLLYTNVTKSLLLINSMGCNLIPNSHMFLV